MALTHFQEHEMPVLVATVAFGMGVDRPDVGLVLPRSPPAPRIVSRSRAAPGGMSRPLPRPLHPGDTSADWAICSSAEESGDPQDRTRAELSQQQLRRMEAVAEGPVAASRPCCSPWVSSFPPAIAAIAAADPPLDGLVGSSVPSAGTTDQRSGVDLRSLGEDLAKAEGDEVDQWRWLARRLVQEDLISESDGSQRLWLRPAGRRFLRQPWTLKLAA